MASVTARRFIQGRRRLAAEAHAIEQVAVEARVLVEELRLRRDGVPPRKRRLAYLRAALDQVDPDPKGTPDARD